MKDNTDNYYQKMKPKNLQQSQKSSIKEKNKQASISRTNKKPPNIIKNVLLSKTQVVNSINPKNILTSYPNTKNKIITFSSQSSKKVNIKISPTKAKHLLFPPEIKTQNLNLN